jgi:hypothetical protein
MRCKITGARHISSLFENQRKCFAENGEVLKIWIFDQKAKGNNVNSILIWQKT